MPRVTLVTPATGRKEMTQCLKSVGAQRFDDFQHVVVIDGSSRAEEVLKRIRESGTAPTVISLPSPTGLNSYGGHRIYGAMPYLANSEFIMHLDEDNWIDPDHISSLVAIIDKYRMQWAYSLRKIFSWNGELICLDNCNSLGWWPAFDGGYNHIDTNCYMLRTEIAIQVSHMWYRRSVDENIETADRALCGKLLREYPYAFTSGKYTSNYRIGSRGTEARSKLFYTKGNRIMESLYEKYPWCSIRPSGRMLRHPCIGWEVGKKNRELLEIYRQMQSGVSPSNIELLPEYGKGLETAPRSEQIQFVSASVSAKRGSRPDE